VGHQEGEVAALDPRRAVAVAGGVQLADVDGELALVVAAGELQEGAVEADDAEAEVAAGEHGGEVAGQHAGLALQGAEGVAVVPGAVVGEGLLDQLAVRRLGVAPELDLDLGEGGPAGEHEGLGAACVGAHEVMVCRGR
jgi:hypothetical protein